MIWVKICQNEHFMWRFSCVYDLSLQMVFITQTESEVQAEAEKKIDDRNIKMKHDWQLIVFEMSIVVNG